ncbi:MAG: hypothetical protein KDC79_03630 [Cyclobacteriaceae bacterium]|nr:hypothetical protein [Cyclobacteriaceae bacterium]
MESNLTEKDSLKLITEMIKAAKGNANQSFFHIILWGWVISIISIAQFIMIRYTELGHISSSVWLLTIPFGIFSFVYGYREGKKEKVRTFIDSIYAWIWVAFIISLILVLVISFRNVMSITPLVLVIAGFATFLSGQVIKFKPLIWGGIAFWAWSLVAFGLQNELNLIINAVAIVTGYLIPGYMLKNKLSKHAI